MCRPRRKKVRKKVLKWGSLTCNENAKKGRFYEERGTVASQMHMFCAFLCIFGHFFFEIFKKVHFFVHFSFCTGTYTTNMFINALFLHIEKKAFFWYFFFENFLLRAAEKKICSKIVMYLLQKT